MSSVTGSSEWTRIQRAVLPKFIKDVADETLRRRKMMAALKARGKIIMDESGESLNWLIKYKESPMTSLADMQTVSYARRQRWLEASLPVRGYIVTDQISEREKVMAQGQEARIKLVSKIGENLKADIKSQFASEIYTDGNATGNEAKVHGVESFMGNSGAASGGYIATPSDTYAGLSTVLGNYGGASWGATAWPDGTGDAHYAPLSPVIVDTSDTLWSSATKTFAANTEEQLRYGLTTIMNIQDAEGSDYLCMFTNQMYRQIKQAISSKEGLYIERGDGLGLVTLGFSDVLNFEGAQVTFEYGVPANTGYGFSLDHMELHCWYSELFKLMGPDYNPSNLCDQYAAVFMGNYQFWPRHFIKWVSVT